MTITSGSRSRPLSGALVAGLAAAWAATVLVSLLIQRVGELSSAYPVKSAATFAGVVLLVAAGVHRYHPHQRFGAANRVTTVRAAGVALLSGLIGEPLRPELALAAAAGAVVVMSLDGVDGWLARRSQLESEFGARFDMETDALLILVLSIVVWQHGKAGAWILLAGMLRYLFIVAGWGLKWLRAPLFPSIRRKAICVVQIAGLGAALLPVVTFPASAWLAGAMLAILGYSFLTDTVWLWRRAD